MEAEGWDSRWRRAEEQQSGGRVAAEWCAEWQEGGAEVATK
jgi:hypothetical protein